MLIRRVRPILDIDVAPDAHRRNEPTSGIQGHQQVRADCPSN